MAIFFFVFFFYKKKLSSGFFTWLRSNTPQCHTFLSRKAKKKKQQKNLNKKQNKNVLKGTHSYFSIYYSFLFPIRWASRSTLRHEDKYTRTHNVSKVSDHSRGWLEGNFQLLLHRGEGEDATPFPGLLHFTLDTYFIMLRVKQGGIKYHFWVFGMTRLRIALWSPGPLANTLPNLFLRDP